MVPGVSRALEGVVVSYGEGSWGVGDSGMYWRGGGKRGKGEGVDVKRATGSPWDPRDPRGTITSPARVLEGTYAPGRGFPGVSPHASPLNKGLGCWLGSALLCCPCPAWQRS